MTPGHREGCSCWTVCRLNVFDVVCGWAVLVRGFSPMYGGFFPIRGFSTGAFSLRRCGHISFKI